MKKNGGTFKGFNPFTAIASMFKTARDADRYMRIMFDFMPVSASLCNRDHAIVDCNQAAVKMFNLTDKKELINNFEAFFPEYQPCGRPSRELAYEYMDRTFEEGYCRFEWEHLTTDGTVIPCEIIALRVEHTGEPLVVAYKFDLRDTKAAFAAMQKVEDDLRLALAVAEDSSKAKIEFLTNMNHELRTPMNGVMGFLRMAAQSESAVKQRAHIADAERSAKKLMKIINDVLDFTDIEDHKMKVNAEQFCLADVFNGIHELFAPAAKAKNLDFIMRLPSDVPELVIGDRHKLSKILANLIDNAVKFTEKGKISVRAAVKNKSGGNIEMSFYVRDTGIGIKPEQKKFMFEPCWQADASITRKNGGTGFGLTLSKHLATLLGGRIWVESEYEEGATFHFTAVFKLTNAMEVISRAAGEQNAEHSQETAETIIKESNNTDEPPEKLPEIALEADYRNVYWFDGVAHDPFNSQLLVVDDIEINQIIAEELLTGMGYAVDVANNGQEAIDMLAEKDYDAVLMDIQMPVMDGLTATTLIREDGKHKDLPIIAISAHAMDEDIEKSIAYGMNDHLTKPLDVEMLVGTLNKWLAPAYIT